MSIALMRPSLLILIYLQTIPVSSLVRTVLIRFLMQKLAMVKPLKGKPLVNSSNVLLLQFVQKCRSLLSPRLKVTPLISGIASVP
jgi:hypothetical protein